MKKLLFFGLMAFAGCSTQLGQFTVYTPKTLDLDSAQYVVDRTKKVRGVDDTAIYVVYAPNMVTYDQAVRNAMATQKNCVGLADMTLKREAFWLVFGYCDFIAEGYPIIKKEPK